MTRRPRSLTRQSRIAGVNAVGGEREFRGTQSVWLLAKVVARTRFYDTDAGAAVLDPVSFDSEHWDHKVYCPSTKRMPFRVTSERGSGRLLGVQVIT